MSRRTLAGLIGAALLAAVFFLEWRVDPTILPSALAWNVLAVVASLTLTVIATGCATQSRRFTGWLRSAGSMPAVAMALASTALLRVLSIQVLPATVLCLGILIGTAATLGELARTPVASGSPPLGVDLDSGGDEHAAQRTG